LKNLAVLWGVAMFILKFIISPKPVFSVSG